MNAPLALFLAMVALTACGPTTAPIESKLIERGTALPPPGLTPPARN